MNGLLVLATSPASSGPRGGRPCTSARGSSRTGGCGRTCSGSRRRRRPSGSDRPARRWYPRPPCPTAARSPAWTRGWKAYWVTVHSRTWASGLARQIADGLPPGNCRSASRTCLRARHRGPTVAGYSSCSTWQSTSSGRRPDPPRPRGVIVAASTIVIEVSDGPVTLGHIEIRRLGDEASRSLTAIEVLITVEQGRRRSSTVRHTSAIGTRTTGPGPTWSRWTCCVTGPHVSNVPLERVRAPWVTPYKCVVHRAAGQARRRFEYYPLPLRDRLPIVSVPLLPDDGRRRGRPASSRSTTSTVRGPVPAPDRRTPSARPDAVTGRRCLTGVQGVRPPWVTGRSRRYGTRQRTHAERLITVGRNRG